MDSESVKLVEQAVADGIASAKWLVLVTSLVAAGIGAFFGSYLKRLGEYRAAKEHFDELLQQLKIQTKATEEIKGEIAQRTAASTESLRAGFAKDLEDFKARLQEDIYSKTVIPHAQDVFVRELYVDGIKEYSSKQAQALRQTYLLLFEPYSSTINTVGKDFEDQLDTAIQVVMQPLREHLGLLDESTIQKIYSVQEELLKFKGQAPEELKKKRNHFFNVTDVARQFVKADKIAFRRGLISHPLEERVSN